MSRPLVVGNGRLLVALDGHLAVRDLYWPYVGLFNHLSGNRIRIGLWVDGAFSWLSDPAWERELRYEPGTLVTDAVATNAVSGVTLRLNDCVHPHHDALLRLFTIRHPGPGPREVRLFLAHDFIVAETDIGDTAFYNPYANAIVHFKRNVYFLMSGDGPDGGIFQYAVGIKGFGGAEGTWRDAEDGWLSMNPVAQGSVDSTFSLRAVVPPDLDVTFRSWICAGEDLNTVVNLQHRLDCDGFGALVRQTRAHWLGWSDRLTERLNVLPAPIPELFRRSLLTIATNTDERGAIIAANDSDIMETARAHYSNMWPRDGALVAEALDRCGYHEITRRFFLFCRAVLPHDRAAFLHKYTADGCWGSTWHPWVIGDDPEIPFQEDSTALVVWALWEHYQRHKDWEFVERLYREMVAPCADFMIAFRDPQTGLPNPSYDLWEERRGVHAYTCGTVYGALTAAAELARLLDEDRADGYFKAAAELRAGIDKYLWDEEAGRYARMLARTEDGYEKDLTVDSALYGLFAFGAVAPDSPRMASTMRKIISRLWVQTGTGGIARYENDYYFRRSEDIERIPGNPWFICTLWAAQWYIAQAETRRDLTTALELLLWTSSRALPSGILAEQLHPESGAPLSVAPLTWSHAEFVSTTLDYLDAWERLPEE